MTLSGYFTLKTVFGQQDCRALTSALARLSCFKCLNFVNFSPIKIEHQWQNLSRNIKINKDAACSGDRWITAAALLVSTTIATAMTTTTITTTTTTTTTFSFCITTLLYQNYTPS